MFFVSVDEDSQETFVYACRAALGCDITRRYRRRFFPHRYELHNIMCQGLRRRPRETLGRQRRNVGKMTNANLSFRNDDAMRRAHVTRDNNNKLTDYTPTKSSSDLESRTFLDMNNPGINNKISSRMPLPV